MKFRVSNSTSWLSILAALCIPAPGQTALEKPTREELRQNLLKLHVTSQVDKQQYLIGERLRATMEVRNPTTAPLVVPKLSGDLAPAILLHGRDPEGRSFIPDEDSMEPGSWLTGPKQTLQPGETFHLEPYVHYGDRAGKYVVSWVFGGGKTFGVIDGTVQAMASAPLANPPGFRQTYWIAYAIRAEFITHVCVADVPNNFKFVSQQPVLLSLKCQIEVSPVSRPHPDP